jgi:hypothetical protein
MQRQASMKRLQPVSQELPREQQRQQQPRQRPSLPLARTHGMLPGKDGSSRGFGFTGNTPSTTTSVSSSQSSSDIAASTKFQSIVADAAATHPVFSPTSAETSEIDMTPLESTPTSSAISSVATPSPTQQQKHQQQPAPLTTPSSYARRNQHEQVPHQASNRPHCEVCRRTIRPEI